MRKQVLGIVTVALAILATPSLADDGALRQVPAVKQIGPTIGGPTIGIRAQSNGWSVQVIEVFPGSAAERLGLERGDGIVQINDIRVRSISDLRLALSRASRFRNGYLMVTVDNVRAKNNPYVQRYVKVKTFLDGFGHHDRFGPPVVTSQRN